MRLIQNSKSLIVLLCIVFLIQGCNTASDIINRKKLVQRHTPQLNRIDSLSPFSVGNGEFAFTVDVTGLQTFPKYYQAFIPLGTQSQWGWHTFPNPNNYSLEQTFEYYDTYGRKVPYAALQHSQAGEWLRANPHRLHLGQIGFQIIKEDGAEIEITDIKNIDQKANIWEGIINSSFSIKKNTFRVETTCHPGLDKISSKITADYLATGKVSIRFDFPYGAFSWGKKTADWVSPEKHTSKVIESAEQSILIERILDDDRYYVWIEWDGEAQFNKTDRHTFLLTITREKEFKFSTHFSKNKITPSTTADDPFVLSKTYWKNFWQSDAAIDLSASSDPRANELERRIILSRYLTAIQCAGSSPPSETGLTYNSWYGKFHLEMHWWHGVHFALWGKAGLFEKSMDWYQGILPMAREKAQRQGYNGVRWPKMVGIDGRESPSTIGVFLIWQQVNPIYFAELFYRLNPSRETLTKYKDIVFNSADFMVSYAFEDKANDRYVLGPPLIPAQEIYKPTEAINPGFELSYWKFGLQTAQKWRERMGLKPDNNWQHVIDHLSALPQSNALYQNTENALNTFEDEIHRNDHPTLLASLGMLNNNDVSIEMMQNTLEKVMQTWNWDHTWGWDYPLLAMTAARVGKPQIAIEALLMDVPKNRYLNNGHNWQRENLTIYLPGNGALLTAVAMMAAGWDGAPEINAPGFPQNDAWILKHEGLQRFP